MKNNFAKMSSSMVPKGMNMKNVLLIIAAIILGVILASMLLKREGFMLGPDTDVMNSCHDLKYKDILVKFNGDEKRMKEVLHDSAHCPRNIMYNDEYAGLMGTYLMNYDPCIYNFGGECKLPHKQQ